MSGKTKVFKATCVDGTVQIDGVELPGAVILSAGQADSQGAAIISGKDAFYVAVPIDTLGVLIELVAQLAQTVSSGVLPSNGGGAITSGTFSTDLMNLKNKLDVLKGHIQ